MFKLFKNIFGEWILVPFESPGLSIVALIIVALLGAKFFALAGAEIILPFLLAFVAPLILGGVCVKFSISPYWLCVLHCFFIQRFMDVIAKNAIKGNPEGLGLINIIILFMVLIIGCGELILISGEAGFPIFFVIFVTNFLYYLSTAIHVISFIDALTVWSLIIQIIMAVISQIVIMYYKNKSK